MVASIATSTSRSSAVSILPGAQLSAYLTNLMILIGAMLIAVQFRVQLPYGKAFDGGTLSNISIQLQFLRQKAYGLEFYRAQRLEFYVVLAVVLLIVQAVMQMVRPRVSTRMARGGRQFAALLLAVSISAAVFFVGWPDLSKLQIGYFAAAAFVLSFGVVFWSAHLNAVRERSVIANLRRLWENRVLLRIWIQYNVRSRYSQTMLGILWIILLPLSTSFVLALAFSGILGSVIGNVPFVVFMLSAIVPWGLFNYGVITGTRSVLSMMGLINQVYFPREILVVLTLGEGLVDLGFTFVAMLMVNALNGYWPNGLFVLLPALLLIEVCMTAGIMFFVSALSVLIRDIPPLVSVAIQLLFFLTPIVYPLESVPLKYRVLFSLNPMAPLITAYRDVFTGRAPDLSTLFYPTVLAIALLYTGYVFFKANEHRFADYI